MRERVAALRGTCDDGPAPAAASACMRPCRSRPTGAQEDEGRRMTIRVLLADDQALLRSAFRILVDSEPDMEVVGEASDGAEASSWPREPAPTSS